MRLAIDPDEHLVEMPAPLRKRPMMDASFPDLAGEHRTEPRFHQNRTVSWQISIPSSNRRSSTCLSDSGKRIYIITARRITSCELLK
jgi:hypothetical protein